MIVCQMDYVFVWNFRCQLGRFGMSVFITVLVLCAVPVTVTVELAYKFPGCLWVGGVSGFTNAACYLCNSCAIAVMLPSLNCHIG